MVMWLIEFWTGLPMWLRLLVPLGFLGASTIMWLDGWIWPYGWIVGSVLLVACIPDKKRSKVGAVAITEARGTALSDFG